MTAFPKKERFLFWQLLIMALHKNVRLQAIYSKKQFVGLDFLVSGKTEVYLAYLAVSPKQRNRGYGSKILRTIMTAFPDKQLIIDIEPVTKAAPNYRQRMRRLKFYQCNGFKRTKEKLVDDGGQFAILTTAGKFNPIDFEKLLKQMSFGLYRFKLLKS